MAAEEYKRRLERGRSLRSSPHSTQETVPLTMDQSSTSTESSSQPRRSVAQFLRKYFWAGQKTNEDLVISGSPPSPFDELVARHRKFIAIAVPFILVQLVYWLVAWKFNFFHLFRDRWEIAPIMAFGATVGGATAEGGGAIAFPVLTLALKIRPEIARDFSVMIQTVGLNAAAVSIQLMGVLIERHTLVFASIGGTAGTVVALEFLDAVLSPAVKKIAFVSVFFSFAIALYLLNKEKKRTTFDQIQDFDLWKAAVLLATGFVGGLLSGIAGSGLEVFAFSIITLLFRINEKVATPTTVSLAGINSVITFFWRGVMQQAIAPLAWDYFIVCIPIVIFFAPIGSLLSSHFHRLTLATFIYILETIALVSAFAVLRPGLPLILLSVSIIAVSFAFYVVLGKAGQRIALKQGERVRSTEKHELA